MTDRELLEFAAKAAGIEWFGIFGDSECECRFLDIGEEDVVEWNPLTDDGTALRLMVKLGLMTHPRVHHEIAVLRFTAGMQKLEATRRAIVLAAAAIGEGMAQEQSGHKLPEDNYYKDQAEAFYGDKHD